MLIWVCLLILAHMKGPIAVVCGPQLTLLGVCWDPLYGKDWVMTPLSCKQNALFMAAPY